MTLPIEPISITDAAALAQAVGDVVRSVGDVETYRRAIATEITRTGDWSDPRTGGGDWQVAWPRVEQTVLPDSTIVERQIASAVVQAGDVAGRTLDLTHPDGRVFRLPLILAHALIAAAFVAYERGELLPPPAPAPAPNPTPTP